MSGWAFGEARFGFVVLVSSLPLLVRCGSTHKFKPTPDAGDAGEGNPAPGGQSGRGGNPGAGQGGASGKSGAGGQSGASGKPGVGGKPGEATGGQGASPDRGGQGGSADESGAGGDESNPIDCGATERACAGKCIADDACCTADDCTNPPATKCLDSSTLREFGAGSCGTDGSCKYETSDTRCGGGCESDACVHDVWVPTSITAAPAAREGHVAVWTGTQMLVWGGTEAGGGAYAPATDTWTSLPTPSFLDNRRDASAVWTGSELIVWGGVAYTTSTTTVYDDGGRYDPTTKTWTKLATTDAPSARYGHSAVWTGSQMLIAGGTDGADFPGDVFIYDAATDTWAEWPSFAALAPFQLASAVWSGQEMILWGGRDSNDMSQNAGMLFDPLRSTALAMTATDVPDPRNSVPAVWSGSEMIMWGGQQAEDENNSSMLDTGGRYDPSTDTWSPLPSNGLEARFRHTAVWTGSDMIVWGGEPNSPSAFDDGARYTRSSNTWTMLPSGAPAARGAHTAVWTGIEMIVWGGSGPRTGQFNTGGRYVP